MEALEGQALRPGLDYSVLKNISDDKARAEIRKNLMMLPEEIRRPILGSIALCTPERTARLKQTEADHQAFGRRQRRRRMRIPPLVLEGFAQWTDSAQRLQLLRALEAGERMIYCYGLPGSGKTLVTCRAIWERATPALYVRSQELVLLGEETCQEVGVPVRHMWREWNLMRRCPILVIDNAGEETDKQRGRIVNAVYARRDAKLTTVLVSRLPPPDLRVGPRMKGIIKQGLVVAFPPRGGAA